MTKPTRTVPYEKPLDLAEYWRSEEAAFQHHSKAVADEVVAHLAGLVGAKVRVALEIEADVAAGVPENVVWIVTENGRTLKFTSQGFEES